MIRVESSKNTTTTVKTVHPTVVESIDGGSFSDGKHPKYLLDKNDWILVAVYASMDAASKNCKDQPLFTAKCYRIVYKSGERWGWAESFHNLDQDGPCAIIDNAIVFGPAKVKDSAIVGANISVFGNSIVCGDAVLDDDNGEYFFNKIKGKVSKTERNQWKKELKKNIYAKLKMIENDFHIDVHYPYQLEKKQTVERLPVDSNVCETTSSTLLNKKEEFYTVTVPTEDLELFNNISRDLFYKSAVITDRNNKTISVNVPAILETVDGATFTDGSHPKYVLTTTDSKIVKIYEDNTCQRLIRNAVIYRIIYSDGTVGGWLEGYHNLSQYGECRVLENAIVLDNAFVRDNAICAERVRVYGNSIISGSSILAFKTRVYNANIESTNSKLLDRMNIQYCVGNTTISISKNSKKSKQELLKWCSDNKTSIPYIRTHRDLIIDYKNQNTKLQHHTFPINIWSVYLAYDKEHMKVSKIPIIDFSKTKLVPWDKDKFFAYLREKGYDDVERVYHGHLDDDKEKELPDRLSSMIENFDELSSTPIVSDNTIVKEVIFKDLGSKRTSEPVKESVISEETLGPIAIETKEKKYVLDLSDKIEIFDSSDDMEYFTLYRVVYKDGTKGGYIQSENNLSQDGSCGVYDEAWVFGGVVICDDSIVNKKARISYVQGDSECPECFIMGKSIISRKVTFSTPGTINSAIIP